MGFSSFVAQRFLRSQRSRTISMITVLAVAGIALGVTALNITLAVMNGFRDQLQLTFVENMPMVSVMTQRPEGLGELDSLLLRIEAVPGIEGASPYIRKEGVLSFERFPGRVRDRATVVWGIDADRQGRVTSVLETVDPPFVDFSTEDFVGVDAGTPGVVLGETLARGLRAGVGDVIHLTVARPTSTMGEFEAHSVPLAVVGISRSGMFEFDNLFSHIDRQATIEIYGTLSSADGIGVKVDDMMKAPQYGEALEVELGSPPYYSSNWISLNQQLFDWIRLEKAVMFLLLLIIIAVAALSVLSILLMMVRDRQRDIGIFMSMGVSRAQLVRIFVQLGIMIGGMGVVLGSLFGFFACLFLDSIGLPLPGDVYFIDTLPVHMKAGDFSLVASAALVMCLLATLMPSWFATRYAPVEVLRYE